MSSLGPVIFFCTVIIGLLILYERKKDDRSQSESDAQFWRQENASNAVRKQDITFLNYIQIPLDKLPLTASEDEEILEYQGIVKTLAHQRILNLTGITNTELKLQYGPANLAELTQYDSNYSTLVNTLAKWGKRLLELEQRDQAVSVLEYGISIGTDVSRNYYLLADIYSRQNRMEEIDRLLSQAETIQSLMKNSILRKLHEIKSRRIC